MPSHNIDFKFISKLEGGSQLTGYVPAAAKSKSGVTIATGFDLGARSKADIDKLNITAALKKKLKPYTSLKKSAAVKYLKANPLTITAIEASSIDKAVKKTATDNLIKRYNASALNKNKIKFKDLPKQAQTVIASVSYQYGTLSSEAPKFWKKVVVQDWTATLKILNNFGDAYPTRRKKEAKLLKQAIPQTTVKKKP